MEIIETLAGDVAVRFHGGGEWFVMDRNGKVRQSPVEFGHALMRWADAENEIAAAYDDMEDIRADEYNMGHYDGYALGYDEGFEAGREKDEDVA